MTSGQTPGFILITEIVEAVPEGGFVSYSPDLDIASQGESIEEAFDNLKDAVETYLAAAQEVGELTRVLKDRGITVETHEPERTTVEVGPSQFVSTFVASLAGLIHA